MHNDAHAVSSALFTWCETNAAAAISMLPLSPDAGANPPNVIAQSPGALALAPVLFLFITRMDWPLPPEQLEALEHAKRTPECSSSQQTSS